MLPGDIVKVVSISRWGGISQTDRKGILISTAYTGYDPMSTRWNVLLDGEVIIFSQKVLRKISDKL